jgi:hypothetical protein
MAGEDEARKGLAKDWSKIPIAERNQCIATMAKGGFPSYVELVVCVEMMRDSRVHREEERATNAKSKKQKTLTGRRRCSQVQPASLIHARRALPFFRP